MKMIRMPCGIRQCWLAAAALCGLTQMAQAQSPQLITIQSLAQAPKIDGKLNDWGTENWTRIAIKPALDKADRSRYGMEPEGDRNHTGSLTLQIKAGVHGDRFYLALRYPDEAADTHHRMWEWRGDKYAEGKQREDMLALRFHLAGNFDRSMLSNKDYKADVWQWSAARTNPSGTAEDLFHHMTTAMLENAAEYTSPDGKTIYIRKQRDTGSPPYRMLPRPKENKGDKLPSFEPATASGSTADVNAKGEWQAGFWHLEFGRALNTSHGDDVVFRPGGKLLGQIAIFNRGYAEHKSISEPLLFDFSTIK